MEISNALDNVGESDLEIFVINDGGNQGRYQVPLEAHQDDPVTVGQHLVVA